MIETLASLDRSFFLLLNSFHASWLDSLMVIFSGQLIWTPVVLLILWSARESMGNKGLALFVLFLLLAIAASDVTSSYMIKNLVNRLRPCREVDLRPLIHLFGQKCGGKFGFVSSHAANSLALVVFAFGALRPKATYFHLLWLLPLIVSYSRVYLGVHYPGDILAGWIIGGGWAFFFGWAFRNSYGASRERVQTPLTNS